MRLRRGYQTPPEGVTVQEADPKAEEADEAAAAQPVDKLLLVVHGIGQNLGGANIASMTHTRVALTNTSRNMEPVTVLASWSI